MSGELKFIENQVQYTYYGSLVALILGEHFSEAIFFSEA